MKTRIILLATLSVTLTGFAQSFAPNTTTGETARATSVIAYQVGQRGANHREWLKVTAATNELGQVEVSTNLAYVELATGLHYRDARGQWQETKEEFSVVPGWAVAHKGPHKVSLAYNLNTAGPVAVEMPDGRIMRSQVLSLYYFDRSTEKSVRLAEIKDCAGMVLPPNRVLYEDAFAGIKADVRFTYTKAGIEQDVILRERPPRPEDLGLNPTTTRLAVLTEFIDPPTPSVRSVDAIRSQSDPEAKDDEVSFGSMWIGRGRAFAQGTNTVSGPRRKHAPVAKKWMQVNGRHFLLEQVSLPEVRDELDKLPEQAGLAPKPSQRLYAGLDIPEAPLAEPSDKPMEIAQVVRDTPGYVLDYLQLNGSLTNYTFQGDMTYYISGTVNLKGTTVFEGGAVLKYDSVNTHQLTISDGTVVCKTGPYRPVIFTSKNDNTVGETISGSSGSPTIISTDSYYLVLSGLSQVELSNLRMAYSYCSFTTFGCSNVVVSDLQILHSYYPFWPVNTSGLKIRNALVYDAPDTVFWVDNSDVGVEHLTVNSCYALSFKSSMTGASMAMTNCLVVGATGLGDVPLSTNCVAVTSSANVFQTVGAGSHYLATNSVYRDAGTTNIHPGLLAAIKCKTTYPPVVYSNFTFNTATVLSPQAGRDTDAPDLGYHSDALDYVVGGCNLSANLEVAAGATVAWFEGYGSVYLYGQPYGIAINNGGKIAFQGTATQPARFVHYQMVQEGNGNWLTRGWMAGLVLNGTGSTPVPEINANHTEWVGGPLYGRYIFRDAWRYGAVRIADSEFRVACFDTYAPPWYFTNCLFDRAFFRVAGDLDASSVTLLNSTFYNGGMQFKRYTWNSPSLWQIKNCAFDGTCISMYDELNANTNSTDMDYNSHNSSNLSWTTYPRYWYAPNTNVLEMVGAHDLTVTNYHWQTGLLGGFYLPTNSSLTNAGSTTADLAGLYHYTTQTNQSKEGLSTVDIGYHYIALGADGLPADANVDGTQDYLQDTDGDGLWDSWELAWFGDLLQSGSGDTDGDGVNNITEMLQGRNPNAAGAVPDSNGVIGMSIFTPLQ